MNFKVKIEGLEQLREKIDLLKKTIKEINDLDLKVQVEEDEIKNLSDCAEKIKSDGTRRTDTIAPKFTDSDYYRNFQEE